MQQSASFSGQGEGGDGGVNIQVMEDMTRLTDKQQMANFLTWGKWDLDDSAIEKLVKDEERKERVSISDIQISPLMKNIDISMQASLQAMVGWLIHNHNINPLRGFTSDLALALAGPWDHWRQGPKMVDTAQEAVTADGRSAAGNSLARILHLHLCLFSKCFGPLLTSDIASP